MTRLEPLKVPLKLFNYRTTWTSNIWVHLWFVLWSGWWTKM